MSVAGASAILAGMIWAAGVVWVGATQVNLPVFALLPGLAFAPLGPGLVLAAMILRQALRRRAGGGFGPGSAGETDERVLANTVEQVVLALCLWPPAAYLLLADGPGVVAALGVAFALARLAFWIGCHRSDWLHTFGFAATFWPTVFALGWAGIARTGLAG